MRIQQVEDLLNEFNREGKKLAAVKLVNDLRGGGLKRSKEIVDNYNRNGGVKNFGKSIIHCLKNDEDWNLIKSNIRKYS